MSDSDIAPKIRLKDITDRMHLRLFMADALDIRRGQWNAQNVHSAFWRFYQNVDDGAFLTVLDGPNAGRFDLAAGRVYFVPAGVRFSCGNEAAFRHFYIHFDVAGLPRLTLHSLFDAPVALPPDADFEASVADFAEYVRGTTELDFAGQCRAKSLVYEGLARYLESLPAVLRRRAVERAAAMEPVSPALEHIEANLSASLSVPQLAALCCLGPDHFARVFKSCVGATPAAYLIERRATRAAQLLLFTDRTIDAIAQTSGFGNRNYFTRRFTQIMGVPPAAYRRNGPI